MGREQEQWGFKPASRRFQLWARAGLRCRLPRRTELRHHRGILSQDIHNQQEGERHGPGKQGKRREVHAAYRFQIQDQEWPAPPVSHDGRS